MNRIRLAFSIFSGIAAAMAGWLYFSGLEKKYEQGFEKIPVVIANRYIEQSAVIEDKDVEIRNMPAEYAQPGHLKELTELFGPDGETPNYMASSPLLKGEQVLGTKLVKLGSETGMSALVPSGKRAFTIVYQSIGIKGIVAPGNRVDILAVFEERSYTLLQNVPVLGVARRIENTVVAREKKNDLENRLIQDDSDGSLPVTIAVSPPEAQLLALAVEKGKVYLCLRPLGDRSTSYILPTELEKSIKSSRAFLRNNPASGDFIESARKKYEEASEIWKKYGNK